MGVLPPGESRVFCVTPTRLASLADPRVVARGQALPLSGGGSAESAVAGGLAYLQVLQNSARVRISMLSRGRASGGEVGSSKAVWAVQRATPSLRES